MVVDALTECLNQVLAGLVLHLHDLEECGQIDPQVVVLVEGHLDGVLDIVLVFGLLQILLITEVLYRLLRVHYFVL